MRRYLLDTNVVSDLVRNPQGHIAQRVHRSGEGRVCTSIIVAAELRYGVTKKGSAKLATQLEAILGALDILAFEAPADAIYGRIRAELERKGKLIGGNDLLIAAQVLAHDHILVTDNESKFSRVALLRCENWLRKN